MEEELDTRSATTVTTSTTTTTDGSIVGRRPRSWGPEPGDALSWLLWQPYDCQSSAGLNHVDMPSPNSINNSDNNVSVVPVYSEQQQQIRTFTSTEAQTEEVLPPPPRNNRRRRQHRLPDLLDSHLPPPYTAPQPLPLPFHIVPSRRR
ncbi:hypothetical protein O3M35_001864 [Rhynocoris fuscipes]|uniref:Uncharacterized protein n=1 Tax=Rhynocoris fuscipes TaxID=488301 RepID=A0AAW1CWI9_9HEMI